MTEAKSSKVKSALLIIGLLLLVFSGVAITLVMLSQRQAGQNQTLAKAEQLADSGEQKSEAANIQVLKSSQRELKEAIALLETIPPSAGAAHQQAQTKSAQIRSHLEIVEQRLENEDAALSTLEDAKQLKNEATDISNNPDHNVASWRTAQAKLQSAINLLKKVPENTFASAQAKQNLSTYLNNYRSVSQKVKTEEAAFATLKKAQALATQASNINVEQGTTELQTGQEKLQQAINLLQKLPTNTSAYVQSQGILASYVNQSNLIELLSIINNQFQDQQKQIKTFVFESTWVNMGLDKQAQLRTLKSRTKGDRAKFLQECVVRFKRQTKTESTLNNFYNELCGYMWAKL